MEKVHWKNVVGGKQLMSTLVDITPEMLGDDGDTIVKFTRKKTSTTTQKQEYLVILDREFAIRKLRRSSRVLAASLSREDFIKLFGEVWDYKNEQVQCNQDSESRDDI